MHINLFQQKILNFYQKSSRNFAWRENITPYKVFISEVMLQQTQTARVVPKFEAWMQTFPNFATLAQASSHQVLSLWQGLGYNRRGLWLYASAKKIIQDFSGQLPKDVKVLQILPGIGPNTAGSICAFAFNFPVVFIETNIRTVFLHEFFRDQFEISDDQLWTLIAASIDHQNPREWYYALMDYGVYLKKELKVNNENSKHYVKQSKFIGSHRQVRGAIVRVLTQFKALTQEELLLLVRQELVQNYHNVSLALNQLYDEKIVQKSDGLFHL